jgi:hypothetical protein
MSGLAIGLLLLLLWTVWHSCLYTRKRRKRIGDLQPLFYPPGSFYALTMLRLAPGQELLPSITRLQRELDKLPGVQVIYAGQTLFTAMQSTQLPTSQWDAVLLTCHPSRRAFERLAADRYHQWLADFGEHYIQGFHRPVLINAMLPVILWVMRHCDKLRKRPSHFPFETADEPRVKPAWRTDKKMTDNTKLDELREQAADAVVVVNLLRHGTAAQRKANSRYHRAMLHLMAEGQHGPIHLGRAINLDANIKFDQLALAYYPGFDYLRSMADSQFYADIDNLKQLNDSLTVVTVPLLNRL